MTAGNDAARTQAALQHVLDLWLGFHCELQSSLALIDGGTQLLLEKELDDDTRELLDIARGGVERIALLTRKAVEVFRCFREPHEEEHSVRFQPLLADVVADIEPWYRERSIDFEHRATDELPTLILIKGELLRTALRCLLKTCAAHFLDEFHGYCWRSCVDFEVGVRDGSIIFKATASGCTSEHVRDITWFRPDMGLAELVRKLGSQLHIEDRAASGWTLWFELGGDVLSGDERHGHVLDEST